MACLGLAWAGALPGVASIFLWLGSELHMHSLAGRFLDLVCICLAPVYIAQSVGGVLTELKLQQG